MCVHPFPLGKGGVKKGSEEMCVCVLLCKCNKALDVMPLHDGVRRKVEKQSVLFLLRLVSKSQKNKTKKDRESRPNSEVSGCRQSQRARRTVNKKGKQAWEECLRCVFLHLFDHFCGALSHLSFKTYRAAATESSPPQRSSSAPTQRHR